MRQNFKLWFMNEKVNVGTILLLILVSYITSWSSLKSSDGKANTVCFLLSSIIMFILLFRYYVQRKRFSMACLIGINIISIVYYFGSSYMFISISLLWIRAIIYFTYVILGLVVIWKSRKNLKKYFTQYLILSLVTVILSFSGIYDSLYSMYFRHGQESFKIDQDVSYEQAVMSLDFIYYSTDCFFGTDISDVQINYIDYRGYQDKNNIMSRYVDEASWAMRVVDLSKILSTGEALLFIIYISIIVMGIEPINSNTENT